MHCKNRKMDQSKIDVRETVYAKCLQLAECEQQRDYRKMQILLNELIELNFQNEVVRYYYAKLLRRSGKFQEALDILETLEPTLSSIQIEKLYCYIELQYWYRAIELCENISIDTVDAKHVKLFLERARIYAYKKVKEIPKMNRDFTYVEKQIYSYSEIRSIRYIQGSKLFDKGFDIENLFQQVKEVLSDSIYTPIPTIMIDQYMYAYSNIRQNSRIEKKILKVETIHNTHDIIYMEPISNIDKSKERMVNKHLLFESLDRESSQVEKFYQKYKKFM